MKLSTAIILFWKQQRGFVIYTERDQGSASKVGWDEKKHGAIALHKLNSTLLATFHIDRHHFFYVFLRGFKLFFVDALYQHGTIFKIKAAGFTDSGVGT